MLNLKRKVAKKRESPFQTWVRMLTWLNILINISVRLFRKTRSARGVAHATVAKFR